MNARAPSSHIISRFRRGELRPGAATIIAVIAPSRHCAIALKKDPFTNPIESL